MSTVDITVFGGGIFGLSVAWAALRRGARVQVVEPRGIGSGASGGLVGALAPHIPENWNDKKQFQFESLIMAEEYWRQVEDASGLPTGYARLGRLQPLPNEKAVTLAESRSNGAETYWKGLAIWQVQTSGNADGWEPPSPTERLIFDSLSARLHPRQAVLSLAAAIQGHGGQIVLEDSAPAGVQVYATGYESLLDLGAGNGVKGQALLLDFDARDKPQLFADGLHIVPHQDGTTAIGSTSEREFDDPNSTDTQLDDIYHRALGALPILAGAAILERWAGVRPRAKSRAPMLGAYPGKPDAFIANGGFKIGFGMAPKIGEVMADLILDGHDAIPDSFRVETCL